MILVNAELMGRISCNIDDHVHSDGGFKLYISIQHTLARHFYNTK